MIGHLSGARLQVFDKIAGHVIARRIIGFGGFIQRVADPHPRAADQLLFHQPGVERAAHFVSGVDLLDGDLAGFVVDGQVHHKRGVGEGGDGGHFAGVGIGLGGRDQENTAAGKRAALVELGGDGGVPWWDL